MAAWWRYPARTKANTWITTIPTGRWEIWPPPFCLFVSNIVLITGWCEQILLWNQISRHWTPWEACPLGDGQGWLCILSSNSHSRQWNQSNQGISEGNLVPLCGSRMPLHRCEGNDSGEVGQRDYWYLLEEDGPLRKWCSRSSIRSKNSLSFLLYLPLFSSRISGKFDPGSYVESQSTCNSYFCVCKIRFFEIKSFFISLLLHIHLCKQGMHLLIFYLICVFTTPSVDLFYPEFFPSVSNANPELFDSQVVLVRNVAV